MEILRWLNHAVVSSQSPCTSGLSHVALEGKWENVCELLATFSGGIVRRSALEQAALERWRKWSSYRKHTFCTDCGELAYCGARRQSGPWLCVTCHDLR